MCQTMNRPRRSLEQNLYSCPFVCIRGYNPEILSKNESQVPAITNSNRLSSRCRGALPYSNQKAAIKNQKYGMSTFPSQVPAFTEFTPKIFSPNHITHNTSPITENRNPLIARLCTGLHVNQNNFSTNHGGTSSTSPTSKSRPDLDPNAATPADQNQDPVNPVNPVKKPSPFPPVQIYASSCNGQLRPRTNTLSLQKNTFNSCLFVSIRGSTCPP
jgi:hypothetical protein